MLRFEVCPICRTQDVGFAAKRPDSKPYRPSKVGVLMSSLQVLMEWNRNMSTRRCKHALSEGFKLGCLPVLPVGCSKSPWRKRRDDAQLSLVAQGP